MPVKKDFCATEIILDIHWGMSPEECIAQFEIDNESKWVQVSHAVRCAGLQAGFLDRYDIQSKLHQCAALISERALSSFASTGGSHEPVRVA